MTGSAATADENGNRFSRPTIDAHRAEPIALRDGIDRQAAIYEWPKKQF